MMMLKEHFRKLSYGGSSKKTTSPSPSPSSKGHNEKSPEQDDLTNKGKNESIPRSSSSTPLPNDYKDEAFLKKQVKVAKLNDSVKSSGSLQSNYTYSRSNLTDNFIPSSYLHQLKSQLPKTKQGAYSISTPQLNKVLDHWFQTPLPNVSSLFPYLHGAISEAQCDFLEMNPFDQVQFYPKVRYMLLIKSNDIENCTLIKSSISTEDIYIEPLVSQHRVINLRNYSCQITLLSRISDFIVYSEDNDLEANVTLAEELINLQKQHCLDTNNTTVDKKSGKIRLQPHYNTYILDYDPKVLNPKYRINQDLSKIDQNSALQYTMNNWNMNYLFHERVELWLMTSKTEVFPNVYLGNVNDLHPENTANDEFSLVINCHENTGIDRLPPLDVLDELYDSNQDDGTIYLDFPSAGTMNVRQVGSEQIELIVKTCQLIYHYTKNLNKSVLIYCFDGYSSLSFLAICLEIFNTGECMVSSLLKFFNVYKRPLYLFKNDYQILQSSLEKRLIEESPSQKKLQPRITLTSDDGLDETVLTKSNDEDDDVSIPSNALKSSEIQEINQWVSQAVDKNLPARVFPHLLLGTFEHASCPSLIKNLNVSQVISFGQIPTWVNDLDLTTLDVEKHYASPSTMDESCAIHVYHNPLPNIKRLVHVPFLEDDGKCSVTHYFEKIYRLIKTGDVLPLNDEINLVHCRVGVSRSASFCILETMKLLNVSLPRAYLYVRVRRLNIIIQPNLKIFYELLKIEQNLNKSREIDWHILCREIDYLNRRYF